MDAFLKFLISIQKISEAAVVILGLPWAVILILRSLNDFRLKIKAEKRLQVSTQAEMDVKLSKLFTDIVWIAHARAGSHVSDKCIEQLFERGFITKQDFDNNAIKHKIEENCIYNLPVGVASQEAAVVCLATLGKRYEILCEPAKAALDSLSKIPQLEDIIVKANAILNEKR